MKEILLPYIFLCWVLVKTGVIKWTVQNAVRMIGLGMFIAFSLFTASRYWAPMDLTDSSTIKAPHATLSAVVGQQIDEIYVKHNQLVKKGDLLYTLRTDNVISQEKALRAQRDGLFAQLEANMNQVISIKVGIANDHRNLARLEKLGQHSSDASKTDLKAKITAQEANASAVMAQAGTIRAQIEGVEAQLDAIDYANERLKVHAPFDGQIGIVDISEGSVNGNLHLYDTSAKYLEMRVPDQAFKYIKPGQFAEFYVDAYPGETFRGRVHSIRSGTGEAFNNPFIQEQHVRQTVGNNMGTHGRTVIIEFDEAMNGGKVLPIGATGSAWISAEKPHSMLGFMDVIGGATVRLKAMKSYLGAL